MSTRTFSRLWEESKAQYHADADARASEFRKTFEKTWSLLRRPFFYVILIPLIFSPFRRRFTAKRNTIRAELAKIVAEYAPQIRAALARWEDGFNQWEKENSGPSLCGSGNALRKEKEGKEQARKLSAKMLEKIGAIPQYDWHFHPIENPAKMVENPYPGFLTSKRARNYCDCLIRAFS